MTWLASPPCWRSKIQGLLRVLIVLLSSVILCDSAQAQARYFRIDAMNYFAASNLVYADTPRQAVDSIPAKPKWQQPGMVALQSAIVPGLGQIRNGQIWKVPIIYGGGIVIYSIIRENNRQYNKYRQAYIFRTDDDTNTIDEYPHFSELGLLEEREGYHTARDLSIIVGVFAYAANILDAYVFAHLKDFDVSEDLGMQIQPVNLVNIAGHTGYTVSLKLNLK